MTAARLRLHYRIVMPFALVALVAIAATAYVALSVATRTIEARLQSQVVSAATLVSQSDFAFNPAILRSVKAIAGADVITFATSGEVVASTLDSPRSAAVVRALLDGAAPPSQGLPSATDAPTVRQVACGGPCLAAFRRVAFRPETVVAVVASTGEVAAANRAVTRTIVIAAVLSLVVMVGVSQFVAKRVSAPLDDLVRFTRDVSDGVVDRRAPAGSDEIGRLGGAFNDMLDRLDASRAALVKSEKLGLAGLIAARVAHDIRNPLSSIKMRTQLLQSRQPDDQNQAMLAAVLHDIATVEAVIRDLLELARPGALTLRDERLNDVIKDVLEQMSPQLKYRKIQVETRFDPSLGELPLDAGRFKQALMNIIANAAEAMVDGGRLSIRTTAANQSTALVEVCDDGAGIDPALIDQVFDPFVTSKREGVGLGLVNTKAVVESHGGRVTLEPLAGRGTKASIWLPVRQGIHG
jgi:signal transduction histidine kinase